MATETYQIKTISVRDKEIMLEVQIISPDEYYFYEKKNFALQLLWDSAQQNPDIKISKAISADQILDPDWVLKNEGKFIEAVEVTETKNYPAKPDLENMTREKFDDFRNNNGTPEAIYKIIVAKSELAEHLKAGASWKSAAYDVED